MAEGRAKQRLSTEADAAWQSTKKAGQQTMFVAPPSGFHEDGDVLLWKTEANLVLIVDFDVALFDANADCVLAVIIADSVAVLLAADQFTATGWHANLDVDALWLASAATML